MKVQVHGWVQDNSGAYHKAGSTLTVDADGGEGCISAKRADGMVKSGSATRIAPAKVEKPPKAD